LRAAEPFGQLALGDPGALAGLAENHPGFPSGVGRGAGARHKL
jgi:hypothetical protein